MGWRVQLGKKQDICKTFSQKGKFKRKKEWGEFKHLPPEEQPQEIGGSVRVEIVGNVQI